MYILYLDDSGSAANLNEQYLVLGGIAVYEAQVDWVTRQLDDLAEEFESAAPLDIEFHASEEFGGRIAPWKGIRDKDRRKNVIRRVLSVVNDSYETARLFACAVLKSDFPDRDPMELAFEDICSRFDMFLDRVKRDPNSDRQRGMIILDRSSYETSLRTIARDFRAIGNQWGRKSRNIADTPLFVESHASRAIQLADHIAYAVFRRYDAGDASYFDLIAPRFDRHEGRVHGLSHLHRRGGDCMCPACLSRRLSDEGKLFPGDGAG